MAESEQAKWLTIKEAARRSRYDYSLVYAAVRAGKLKAYQREQGASWRIKIEDLDAWIMGGAEVDTDQAGR